TSVSNRINKVKVYKRYKATRNRLRNRWLFVYEIGKIFRSIYAKAKQRGYLNVFILPTLSKVITSLKNAVKEASSESNDKKKEDYVKEFKKLFPKRKDKLTSDEILPFLAARKIWAEIFGYFDIVQCYGGYPIWGLVSGAKYVALEHGTLRD